MLAWEGAGYLHYRYGWEYALPAYVLSVAIAGARVKTKSHSWTDVIGTAAIMEAVCFVIVSPFNQKNIVVVSAINPQQKHYQLGIKMPL